MCKFEVTHADNTKHNVPSILRNPLRNNAAVTSTSAPDTDLRGQITAVQRQLPEYGVTPLIGMPSLAEKLGQSHVFIKDESNRFGLPSFKILGASWAIYRVLCNHLGLMTGEQTSFDVLRQRLRQLSRDGRRMTLVACSAGNWGRACARMAAVLEMPITILLPKETELTTRDLIDGEGPTVYAKIVDASYDAAVKMAEEMGKRNGHILVMDTSWEGFTEFPSWVVHGYSTMLDEVEAQVEAACGKKITTVVVSVGVGSWAQAVVERYRAASVDRQVQIVTVEPERAACLLTSLSQQRSTPIATRRTIMNGMNCGTVSDIAWPALSQGVDVAVAVKDEEVDIKTKELQGLGHPIGPCGAATVVACDKLYDAGVLKPDSEDGVVVLFSTEGPRTYELS